MKHSLHRLMAFCLCLTMLLTFTACRLTSSSPADTSSDASADASADVSSSTSVDASTPASPSQSALFAGNSYGASVGSLLSRQISGLGQSVDNPLPALTQNLQGHAQVEAGAELALQSNRLGSFLNALLGGTTVSFRFRSVEDTWCLHFGSAFSQFADSDLSLEGIYDGSDLYLSMPGYLDTALQLPLDSLVDVNPGISASPSDLLSHLQEQFADDEMQQLVDGFFTMLSAVISDTLSAIPDDACSVTDTTFALGGSAVPVQQLTVSLTPETWYTMVHAALSSLCNGSSSAAFFQALTDWMSELDEVTIAVEDWQNELQDTLDNLSLDNFSEMATGELTVTGTADTIYAASITLSDDETALSIHLQDTRSAADGSLTWALLLTGDQGASSISCSGRLSTGASTAMQMDLTLTEDHQETLSLHLDSETNGNAFSMLFSLEAANQSVRFTVGMASDANQTWISLDDLFVTLDGIAWIEGGSIALTFSASENPDSAPYTAPGDSISLDEFANNEDLGNAFLNNLFANPVLFELMSGMLA